MPTTTIYPCGCRRGAETTLCPAAEQLRDAAHAAYRAHGGDSPAYLEAAAHYRSHTAHVDPYAAVHYPRRPRVLDRLARAGMLMLADDAPRGAT